ERALSFLLEHALIAEHPEVPAGKQLSDLAAFLSDYDLAREEPLEERFSKLQFWGGKCLVMSAVAVVPVKLSSDRVKDKNFRDFFEGHSLFDLLLKKLHESSEVSRIFVSTNAE